MYIGLGQPVGIEVKAIPTLAYAALFSIQFIEWMDMEQCLNAYMERLVQVNIKSCPNQFLPHQNLAKSSPHNRSDEDRVTYF